MSRKQAPLSRSIVFVYCVTVKFAYRGNLHRPNIGLCKLLFSAKLEASLFDGILKGGFVNIIVSVPLHAEFLTRDICFCGKNSVQAQRSLFDAGLAMATTHTENTIRHNYRFLVFLVMTVAVTFAFMVVIVAAFTMFVVIITFAAAIVVIAAAMSAATALMSKLGINDQHGKQPSADIIEYTQSSMTMTFG